MRRHGAATEQPATEAERCHNIAAMRLGRTENATNCRPQRPGMSYRHARHMLRVKAKKDSVSLCSSQQGRLLHTITTLVAWDYGHAAGGGTGGAEGCAGTRR